MGVGLSSAWLAQAATSFHRPRVLLSAADVTQMIPLVTCEILFGYNVCEFVFGVDVLDFELWVQINSIKQPIKSNSVSWKHVSLWDFCFS